MAGPETSNEVRRCPSCGARNRGSGPWCTLCHTDLTAPARPTAAESPAGLVAEDEEGSGAAGPSGAAGEEPAVRPTGEVDPQLLEQLLVQLHAQESGIRLPGRLSGLQALLRPGASRATTVAFGVGAMAAVTVVVVALLAVVGLVL